MREREFDDGNIGVEEGGADGRGVGGGGKDGDGGGAAVEEAGEVEDRDDMALREEWEDGEVWRGRRSHGLIFCANDVSVNAVLYVTALSNNVFKIIR